MMKHSSLQASAAKLRDATASSAAHKWARFIPRDEKEAALRMESAKVLVRAVLDLREALYSQQLAEILSVCIWKMSEAKSEHKHRTRYRSAEAQKQILSEGKWDSTNLRHDHVFERKFLINAFKAAVELEDKAEVERLLVDLFVKAEVACTVTKDEHDKQLGNTGKHGWQRYRAAGIKIIDTLTASEGIPNADNKDSPEPFASQ